jgi:hypothetical protein
LGTGGLARTRKEPCTSQPALGSHLTGFPFPGILAFQNLSVTTIKVDPLLLRMPDNGYWTIGDRAGKAWNDGKKLMNAERK